MSLASSRCGRLRPPPPAGPPEPFGRAEDVQWRMINEPYLSRYQFRVEAAPQSFRLVDLGSKNGTWVSGSRVTQRELRDGDRIECGPTVIAVSFLPPSGAESR